MGPTSVPIQIDDSVITFNFVFGASVPGLSHPIGMPEADPIRLKMPYCI